MSEKLKKIFEKEYMNKGMTQQEADMVFYAYENQTKQKRSKRK